MNYNETLMWKEINETPGILKNIMAANGATIDKIAAEAKARNIKNITGAARGTSDHALVFFKYLTEIFSQVKVGLVACSAVTMYDGKVNYGDNMVVGVSQSGKAVDVLEIFKKANAQGAMTVAVTNDENSPMAREAKFHLFCGCGAEKSVAATKTFSAQCFLLMALAGKMSDSAIINNGLASLPLEIEREFSAIASAAEGLSKELMGIKDGFILGRGITYAIALESTLKLQETCYIAMKGYAESDFQHGPMAMVGKGTPLIIYAPKIGFVSNELEEKHIKEFSTTIEKMKSFGGNVKVVADSDEFDAYNPIKVPKSSGEMFSFFKFAIFAQTLACFISCGIGNNPDSPRALNKVTITK